MSDTDKVPDENEVLRRMLNTPPKPHEFGETKKDGGKQLVKKPGAVKKATDKSTK